MNTHLNLLIVLAMLSVAAVAFGVKPTRDEMRRAKAWANIHLNEAKSAPFSFIYGGRPSSELLPTWTKSAAVVKKLGKNRTERTVVYTDPNSGLQVRCVAVEYADFPTVEWTLRFTNTGKSDTPILSDIRPLDLNLQKTKPGEFKLHWNTADNCSQDSYQPHIDVMAPSAEFRSASAGGRPTTGGYPFWNVEFDGGGQIVVLSWGGQWSAQFVRDASKGFHLTAGQELTRFTLRPGEEVSSPTAITQFYEGDWIRSQNVWRRWMVAHNMPKPGGKPVKPFTYGCDGDQYPGLRTNIDGEKTSIARFCQEGMTPDYWDQDAGWYPCGDVWWNTGDWQPDKSRFPKGLKELSDFLHENKSKLMLWFEPERAVGGSPITTEHPDWFYGGKDGGLIKLGEATVWKWMVEHFDGLIKSEGVDIYRQDFNIGPLDSWRGNDSPDRQGITEIRHVEGYYAYWDELLRRNPGLLIDTCASGGRRNNVETLRRSVPVLRSDYASDPIGNQGHTYGLSLWVPFYGTGQLPTSAYEMRSAMCPIFGIGGDVKKPDLDWNLSRRSKKEWLALAECFLGDYYPLTPYSIAVNNWIAWQFDVPEKGKGMVLAFRRDQAQAGSMVLKLRELDASASYEVKDFDTGLVRTLSGGELMGNGLTVRIGSKPGSAMVSYRKVVR